MKLIFIRHGDPDYEKDSLTEKGWREAEILAKRVATWDIKQIYCSPLGRAKDTCSVSLKETGREAITCDWLKEFYYRIWDEQEGEWTIAWDFYPRDFNHRDDFHDKDQWYETGIMKSGNIKEHAQEVFAGFDELLEKHGEDPGMKARDGGYFFTYGMMVEPFEKASFALSEGQVSNIIETDFGYHIIKRLSFTPEELYASPDFETIVSHAGSEKFYNTLNEEAGLVEFEYTENFEGLAELLK